jgi:hypothetical protein
MKEKGKKVLSSMQFSCCCSFQTTRLIVDELRCANVLIE